MSDLVRIGVFDSGLGGLTVLRRLLEMVPTGAEFMYVGDTARVPYGGRSPATIIRYTLQAGSFFIQQGADAMVVACNSASAVALPALQAQWPGLNLHGVIEPAVEAAASLLREGDKSEVAVLSTRSTRNSRAYPDALGRIVPDARVRSVACPLFVPIVEEGLQGSTVAQAAIDLYLQELAQEQPEIAILGCTHYPLLIEDIARSLPGTTIIDSAGPTATRVAAALGPLASTEASRVRLFATDIHSGFQEEAARFLGAPAPETEFVDLEQFHP